jgi:hypothetical protein
MIRSRAWNACRGIALAVAAWCAMSFACAAVPNILWESKIYGVDGRYVDVTFSRYSGAVDSEGNAFVVGVESIPIGGSCVLVVKLGAADGRVIWRKSNCAPNVYTGAFGVAVDANGDAAVVGWTGYSAQNVRTLKYSGRDGSILWDRLAELGPEAAGFEEGLQVIVDNAGAFVVAAVSGEPAAALIKYSGDGVLQWQVRAGASFNSIAADADRNIVMGGITILGSSTQWAVTKFSGANGAVVWRRESGIAQSSAHAAVVDSRGDVVATGSIPGAGGTDMRTIKYAKADGRALWQSDLATTGSDAGFAVATNGTDVVVTGKADYHVRTIKYRSADGVKVWDADYVGPRGTRQFGDAVALDDAGNVIVGATVGFDDTDRAHQPVDIRTLKYAAADGAVIWSWGYSSTEPGNNEDGGLRLIPTRDGIYLFASSYAGGPGSALYVAKYGMQVQPPLSVHGLWWNAPAASESGWGLNISQQGDLLFATWFNYETDGTPSFIVMSGLKNLYGDNYFGAAYRTRGPPFTAVPFDASQVQVTDIGFASLRFSDARNGTFSFLESATGFQYQRQITRTDFSSPEPQCAEGAAAADNYQDLWWASPPGSEAGWGLQIAHQGDTLFATWFTYAADGRATWFVGSDVRKTGAGTYAGTLYRITGPTFRLPWLPSKLQTTPVGSLTLSFADPEHGTFAYTIGATSQTKRIERAVLASPGTRCR